jgi:uncharacterized protein with NRDE domain
MPVFKNKSLKISDTDQNFNTLCTADSATVIHSIYISNNSVGANAEIVLEVVDGSTMVSVPILDRVPLRANTTLMLEKPINLESTDSVRVKSSTGCPITVFASVMEV